eukprot:TRINITY_DN81348_c0_g1_i1.p1 TRINITY_DN81348_c0_g1~~TRINITY_DN81348_c0_g1_i1.p1  ORF type:complete len:523 (+),score=235.97 TRINITY_DN81348_c0_g1_i1:123-1691(+)
MPPKKSVPSLELTSLENFDEKNPKCDLNSPRSLQACKSEGVLAQELLYKPPEAFAERGLSPRLVKLRYDFFEAKRRDLLAAAKRARDQIMTEEKREKGEEESKLALISKESGLTKGAVLALQGDTLRKEREKLLKAQQIERTWLQNALNMELKQLQTLEQNNSNLTKQASNDMEAQKEKARKIKELNDQRAAEEERKAREAEARAKLEKQIAKEEFAKQQEDLEKKAKQEAIKQRAAYERQCAEADRKKEAERLKQEKKEAEAREQEARKNELRAQDLRRQEVMEQQKASFQMQMREKQEARDLRIYQSIQANMEIETKRRNDYEAKCANDAKREERLLQARALQQEQSAKQSFQVMMTRKRIQEEAARKDEERRSSILEGQEDTEMRLLEHEQKKERYLDFKRELDGLRSKNKEINVERQRRKEEAHREKVAEEVRKKDEKIDAMRSERTRLWGLRAKGQSEAYRAREMVKTEIIRQRIASKFDSKKLLSQLEGLMSQDIFHPTIIEKSASMPSIRQTSVQ